jgi:DNA-binding NarL/FixJ family response regulator
MTRVLVVAASPVVRAGLAAVLEQEGAVVVGVDDGAHGLPAVVASAQVEVVLWAPLPDDVVPTLAATVPSPALVVLAPRRDAAWARRALVAGARAVLEPEPTAEEIVGAVDAAARGLLVLAPALAATLLEGGGAMGATSYAPTDARDGALTPRELEILGWLAQGLANKQVATRLGLSEHTVKTHVAHVFEKLGVGTRAEAVARAVRLGVLVL